MAKIRVYELARDLNMTNREVIEKLNLYGYSILTHTNSIEEEEAIEFKQKLKHKAPASVEETRVKPTVIRRRKRAEELAELPEEIIETKEAEKIDEAIAVKETKEEALYVEELKPEPVEIIETPREIEEKAEILPEEAAQKVEDVLEVKETLLQVQEKPAETVSKKKIIRAFEPEVEREAKSPQVEKFEKFVLKKRRGKKDIPARIIKLGPAAVMPQPPEAKEAPKPPPTAMPEVKPVEKKPVIPPKPAEVIPISTKLKEFKLKFETERIAKDIIPSDEEDVDATSRDRKKKFGKRRPEESAKEFKFLKRKIPFRKKEIIEGAELYSKENRIRKLQKAEKAKKAEKGLKPLITIPKAIKRRIKIDDMIVISDLAKRIGIKAGEIIKKLLLQGMMVTVNQAIDFETAALMASEFNYEVEKASFEEDSILKTVSDDPDKLISRPPVVTVMGHVDHGKTSLLDVIRKTRVTEQEAGGITQHIGAYHVNTERGQIVFLDTPGHEAFTAMRSRGASITDIVVLVVAADDGVMPQTIEAINHSRAANVPIIVAINKIDKPDADPDRVQRELVDKGLAPEEWGGDTIFVRVSAKKGTGIEELLEMILLQAELMELKANPAKLAYGHVIEAKLDSGRGPVATVLVQDGALHAGEPIVCGVHYGKIRALLNDRGQMVQYAGPSMPVEIIGLAGVPNAGDEFIILADERDAKQVSSFRTQKQREKELARTNKLSLENLFEHMKEGKVKDLNIIIKADVHGSIEALKDSLVKLSNEEVKINVLHAGTGAIAESDVSLAMVSNAIIIGFNVRPNAKIMAQAQEEDVDIRYYNIIYNVIQDVQSAIVGMMASTFEEKVLGNAEVREVFHIPKIGAIAGCYVQNGKIQRGQPARLIREGVVLYDGKISSLRRFKDDAKEVLSGFECGIGIENYNDIKLGDIIECYFMEEIKPEI